MAIKLPPNIQKKLLKEAKENNGRISAKEYNNIVGNQKKLLKKGKENNGRISAKEYNNLVGSQEKKKVTRIQSMEYAFNFEINLSIEKKEVNFILSGRHLSTNDINTLHFRNKLRYKTAIKKAVREYFLVHKKEVGLKNPCKSVIIYPTAYNVKSRDDDGNSGTLKILRDLITEMGYVIDDSRKYLIQERCKEVLTKDYKIEILLKCKD